MNALNRSRSLSVSVRNAACLVGLSALPLAALGSVTTYRTMDVDLLRTALNPVGLTIDAVSIHNGVDGQFGTFSNFETRPITIRPGIVLSSGYVDNLGPIPGATAPEYDPASPPEQVSSQMVPEPDSGGTPEFDAYGAQAGNIENFNGSYDVAALRIDFTLDQSSAVKFDFIFGSVEFPYWTSQFTDSFLVFLDGTDPANQITLDAGGNAVQVGSSFAGFETIEDLNSAFSNPHGLIHHLTTTTAKLPDGEHFLIFEIGDVNDHILDSAVFISNLRAEDGAEGTEPTEDPPYEGCPHISAQPQPTIGCLSGSVSFTVTASGDPPLTFRWSKDGVPIETDVNPTAASPTLEIANISAADIGEYECVIRNSCDHETTHPAALTVCIGDYNCDGGVDGTDVGAFFDRWELGDAAADVNADGGVDGADVSTFFEHWEGGC